MHFEILVEDSSGRRLLDHLVPKLIGPHDAPHTWKLHAYKGIGRIPGGLAPTSDPSKSCGAEHLALFRLAIEEIEAWYPGDREALLSAYPAAKRRLPDTYIQDAVCGTWERLADIVHPGGARAIQKAGWLTAGDAKHEWASKIGPLMDPDRNLSPSFGKLRDGLRRLAQV